MSKSIDELVQSYEIELRKGAIQLLVFASLDEQDLHGMAICELISKKTSGFIDVPLGTIYPLLSRFVNEYKLIETYKPQFETDRRRTYYKLNNHGKAYYYLILEKWTRYSAAISNYLHSKN